MNKILLLVVPMLMIFTGCRTTVPERFGKVERASPSVSHDPLLEAMVGRWVARGTIEGENRVDDVEAAWILNGNYLRLHEVSRNKTARGQPVYEAVVLMEKDPQQHDYACLWLDTTGGGGLRNQAARGQADGDSLRFKFGKTGTFLTTLAYDRAGGTWDWIMDDDSSGKSEPFARLKLTKHSL